MTSFCAITGPKFPLGSRTSTPSHREAWASPTVGNPCGFSANSQWLASQPSVDSRADRLKTEVLKNLRALLGVARSRSSEQGVRECKFSQQILAQYRARQHETDRVKMRAFRAEATDYLLLLSSMEEQKFLWALDAGAEKKLTGQATVDASARRVGLEVPETSADKQDKQDEERKRAAAAKYLADKRAKEAASKH